MFLQGRWSSGRAGGAVKGLRTMPTYKKKQQKNRYQ